MAIFKSKIEVGASSEELNKYIDKLKVTINDMLILSARQINNNTEQVDIALIAAQAVDDYLTTGRTIKLEIPEDGVTPIAGNESWFYRCVANLLDNAIKYSNEDTPINVCVKEKDNAVILSVEDFGMGISKKDQENIWQPYYSINSGKSIHGLGLSLINNVVDLCGGMVWVNSSQNKGSTFYLSLPISLS